MQRGGETEGYIVLLLISLSKWPECPGLCQSEARSPRLLASLHIDTGSPTLGHPQQLPSHRQGEGWEVGLLG